MAEQPLDLEHYKMLTMYANGVPAVDIAKEMGYANPGTVYQKLAEFPSQYADAKRRLAEARNAKYRRIGALASDILMDSLEKMKQLVNMEDDIETDLREKRLLLSRTDPVAKDVIADINVDIISLECKLKEIADIRADLKTISTVAENAERRADLNEGNPTERIENTGEIIFKENR